jgi:putative oxidoreductase
MTIPSTTPVDLASLSAGLLITRLVLGLGLAAHGAQKLFGWFGGYGLAGTGGFFESLGFRPGKAFAAAAGLGELGGGLLVALGLLGPIGPAVIISVLVVAMAVIHWRNGFFVDRTGIEHPLLYAAGALALAFTGFGEYSLDAVSGLAGLGSPALAAGAVIAGVLGSLSALALRRPPVSNPAQAHG